MKHLRFGGGLMQANAKGMIGISSLNLVRCSALGIAYLLFAVTCYPQQETHKTKNVILVMIDGVRWEEVFRGADPKLLKKHSPRPLGASKTRTSLAKERYWRQTADDRRDALMPFLWRVVATQGQVFGNRKLGSDSHVRNHSKISYPGYNETLTGFADPHILSNRNEPNPNVTFMEWLNRKPEFAGKVAAFGAWQVFEGIFNDQRCGFLVNAGYEPLKGVPMTPELALLNTLKERSPRVW